MGGGIAREMERGNSSEGERGKSPGGGRANKYLTYPGEERSAIGKESFEREAGCRGLAVSGALIAAGL